MRSAIDSASSTRNSYKSSALDLVVSKSPRSVTRLICIHHLRTKLHRTRYRHHNGLQVIIINLNTEHELHLTLYMYIAKGKH
jgi:hypothetical protein